MSTIFIDESHDGNILQNLWLQYQRKEYCDLVLIVGTEKLKIQTHRNVLAAAGEYFVGILNANRTNKEVKIANLRADIFQKLIEYIYTGRVEISDDSVLELLDMANVLLQMNVVTACGNFLVEKVNSSNCLKFMFLAEKYSFENLSKESKSYCLKHFVEVIKTAEFLNLNIDQLLIVIRLSRDIDVPEKDIFNSLKLWVEHKSNEREKHKAELLKLLRMPMMEQSFLFNNVRKFCTSLESLNIYTDALEYQLMSCCSGIKITCDQFIMATVYDKNNKGIYIHYYCPQQLKWMKWPTKLQYRYNYSIAVLEDNIYIVGGRGEYGHGLNSVIRLNLKTMTVSESTPMIEKRNNCQTATLKGFLYAVGGYGLNCVEKWDPIKKSWSKVASMSVQRYNFGIAVLNEKLYVVGGYPATLAEFYDPRKNIWTSILAPNERHDLPGIAVSNGLIYVVGGDEDNKTVERYDPATNKWVLLRRLNEKLHGCESCTTYRGKVVVCYKDRIEEYNEEKNEWISKPSSNTIGSIQKLFTYSGIIQISEFEENVEVGE